MTKSDFLDLLRERISALPDAEAAKTVVFYSEMIDDRIEDGMDEEEAVAALGSIDDIVDEVCAGISTGDGGVKVKPRRSFRIKNVTKKLSERVPKTKIPWKMILIIVTSPIWIMVLAGLLMAAVGVYATVLFGLWSLVVGLFFVSVSLLMCAPIGFFISVIRFATYEPASGLFLIGAGLFLTGGGLLLLRVSIWFTRLSTRITKWMFIKPVSLLKNLFGRIKK